MGFLKDIDDAFRCDDAGFHEGLMARIIGRRKQVPHSQRSDRKESVCIKGRLGWAILNVASHCIRQTGRLRCSINSFRNRARPGQT